MSSVFEFTDLLRKLSAVKHLNMCLLKFVSLPCWVWRVPIFVFLIHVGLDSEARESFLYFQKEGSSLSVPQEFIDIVEEDLSWLRAVQTSESNQRFKSLTNCSGRDVGACLALLLERSISTVAVSQNIPEQVLAEADQEFPRFLWISSGFLKLVEETDRIKRLSVLLHEAAHFLFGVDHEVCPEPLFTSDGDLYSDLSGYELGGLLACDDSINGSYVFEAIVLNHLAKRCTNCTEGDMDRFRNRVDYILPRILVEDLVL